MPMPSLRIKESEDIDNNIDSTVATEQPEQPIDRVNKIPILSLA
jgi:hypothetical protein